MFTFPHQQRGGAMKDVSHVSLGFSWWPCGNLGCTVMHCSPAVFESVPATEVLLRVSALRIQAFYCPDLFFFSPLVWGAQAN